MNQSADIKIGDLFTHKFDNRYTLRVIDFSIHDDSICFVWVSNAAINYKGSKYHERLSASEVILSGRWLKTSRLEIKRNLPSWW